MTDTASLLRAQALSELGRWDDAVSHLRTVLATDPHNEEALSALAFAQYHQDDYDQSLRTSLTLISDNPESEWPHRMASWALLALGREQQAYAMGREAVRLAPNLAAAHASLAQMLADSPSDLREARAAAEWAVFLAPHEASSHIAVGVVAGTDTARWGVADKALHRALALEPESSVAHHQLAQQNLALGHFGNTGALAHAAGGFATLLRMNPGSSSNRYNFDLCVHRFLIHTTYVLFFVVLITLFVISNDAALGALMGLGLLLLPAATVGRFVCVLAPQLRGHLSVLRSPLNEGAALCHALAATGLILGAIFPRLNWAGLWWALAFVVLARIILWYQNRSLLGNRTKFRRYLWRLAITVLALITMITMSGWDHAYHRMSLGDIGPMVALAKPMVAWGLCWAVVYAVYRKEHKVSASPEQPDSI
jgi:tetratricopeptide (TPR) repeat protein